MSRFDAYVRNAAALVQAYDGNIPLASYLKQYFSGEKKFGSTDRKTITSLCHQYFRLGNWPDNIPLPEKILLAEMFCISKPSKIILNLKPEWGDWMELVFKEKLSVLGLSFEINKHTPWLELLESEIAAADYCHSYFLQPNLFLRCRPGKKQNVLIALEKAGVPLLWEIDNIIALTNGSKVDELLNINQDVVVQDFGSQLCGQFIFETLPNITGTVWDACAASGGKSIHLFDLYGNAFQLIVSDIRESILANLKQRFQQAGIKTYRSYKADLSRPNNIEKDFADIILVDAPCTGSGTWARTPEQHHFFKPEMLEKFVQRQRSICENVLPVLKSSGYLIYITCSVFSAENEQVKEYLLVQHGLTIVAEKIINGTTAMHDSMYVVILQKS